MAIVPKKAKPFGSHRGGAVGRAKTSDEVWEKFLVEYEKLGIGTQAAANAGLGYSTVRDKRLSDPEFEKRFQEAKAAGLKRCEDEIRRRAFAGYEKPVFHQGVEVGTVTEFSDTLAMFMMRAARPEKYRERIQTENVNVNLERGPNSRLTDEELDAEIKRRLS